MISFQTSSQKWKFLIDKGSSSLFSIKNHDNEKCCFWWYLWLHLCSSSVTPHKYSCFSWGMFKISSAKYSYCQSLKESYPTSQINPYFDFPTLRHYNLCSSRYDVNNNNKKKETKQNKIYWLNTLKEPRANYVRQMQHLLLRLVIRFQCNQENCEKTNSPAKQISIFCIGFTWFLLLLWLFKRILLHFVHMLSIFLWIFSLFVVCSIVLSP